MTWASLEEKKQHALALKQELLVREDTAYAALATWIRSTFATRQPGNPDREATPTAAPRGSRPEGRAQVR
jgi:hypothetical protein